MSDSPKKSLASKLAEVMGVANRIPKRGRNEFHKYDYATEADIADAIRSELSQRQVILVPAIVESRRDPVGDKGSVLTTLVMEFTFIDGESGEHLASRWMGAGTDKEDKGLYKAMTGGEKYFLLKTFLMPTGDDPERDTTSGQQAVQQRVKKDEPRPAGYDKWALGLKAAADNGMDALRAAWLTADPSFRRLFVTPSGEAWEALKDKAAAREQVSA